LTKLPIINKNYWSSDETIRFALSSFPNRTGAAPKISSLPAQALFFCEDVDEDDYPKNESSSFTIGSEGGWLEVLVKLDDEVDWHKVKYVIYKVSKSCNEKNDGKHNVYAYDKYDNFLASGAVRTNFKD